MLTEVNHLGTGDNLFLGAEMHRLRAQCSDMVNMSYAGWG